MEKATKAVLRCVVGPVDTDADCDWLRFLDEQWMPIAQERWVPLGQRHKLFGLVGGHVNLQLSFRDARGYGADQEATLEEVVHFERAVHCADPNVVFLNIFDLVPVASIPNAVLNNTMVKSVGAFHAAVEVYNDEWSFYRTPNPESCGVAKSLRPRSHPVHVFRESINLGTTDLQEWEVRYLIRSKLAPLWRGGSYDLVRHNCIHFCDELLLHLGAKPVPDWVCGLHETGAGLLKPFSYIFGWDSEKQDARPQVENGATEDEEVKKASEASNHAADLPVGATIVVPEPGGKVKRF